MSIFDDLAQEHRQSLDLSEFAELQENDLADIEALAKQLAVYLVAYQATTTKKHKDRQQLCKLVKAANIQEGYLGKIRSLEQRLNIYLVAYCKPIEFK